MSAQTSAIVPARNEENNIESAVRGLAAQPEVSEIIVVDDQSTDGTPTILAQLAAEIPRLKVLRCDALPAGWVGKNHALWIGAQAASGDWLLFTDADTVLLPNAAHHAIDDSLCFGAALVSYSPEQVTQTFFERALIPFIYCRLARKFDFARVSDPSSPDAAANGQFILVRRDAYEKIGGHSAVAATVLEDVALARRFKQAGFRLHFASGDGIARTRMYRSFGAMWQGWTKNLDALLGGTFANAGREIAVTFPWLFLVLLITGTCAPGRFRAWFLAGAAVALALRHAWYAHELRANRYSMHFIIYYGLAAPLYAVMIVASAWKHRGGKIAWKGREYTASGK
ncbi:MAG TPA: glycosyltransferase [Candidatus Acidoferrales bacterium]|nr:glycosyltransferase [Candidatus Acidoferrales bacterium]